MSATSFRAAILAAAAAALLIVQSVGAQSEGVATPDLTREQALFDSGSINQFARENLGSFSTAVLKNGIPVIIKRSTTNRILSLKTLWR